MLFEIDIRKELNMISKNKIDFHKTEQCISYIENYFLWKIRELLNFKEDTPGYSLFSKEPELLERVQVLLSGIVDNLADQVLSKIDVDLFKTGGPVFAVAINAGIKVVTILVYAKD